LFLELLLLLMIAALGNEKTILLDQVSATKKSTQRVAAIRWVPQQKLLATSYVCMRCQ